MTDGNHKSDVQLFAVSTKQGDSTVGEIYVHDVISRYWWGISPQAIRQEIEMLGDVDRYEFNIMSDGGSASAAFAIANIIKKLDKPTTAHVEVAFSAATVISLACDEVVIAENGYWMMHHAMVDAYMANAAELLDLADRLEKLDNQLIDIYSESSTMDQNEILENMVSEKIMVGQEVVDAGFAARLAGVSEAAAQATPNELLAAAKERTQRVREIAAQFQRPEPQEPKKGGDPVSEGNQPNTQPATLNELKAISPDVTAEFIVEQQEAEATIADAQAAWNQHLADENAQLKKQLEDAQASNSSDDDDDDAAGTEPLGSARSRKQTTGSNSNDAVAEWNARLKDLRADGKTKQEAVACLVKDDPELHQQFLDSNTRPMQPARSRR